jgi:hypothetical protein
MRRITPLLFALVLCGLAHAQSERRDLALTVANTYAVVTANGTATCPIGGLRLSDGSLRFPFAYRGMNSEVVLPAGTNIAAIQAAILAKLPAMDVQAAITANLFNQAIGSLNGDLTGDLLTGLKGVGAWLVSNPNATAAQALAYMTATYPDSSVNWSNLFVKNIVKDLGMSWAVARGYLAANYSTLGAQ